MSGADAIGEVIRDGQSFCEIQPRTTPPPPTVAHLNLAKNWFEEQKQKVPVKR